MFDRKTWIVLLTLAFVQFSHIVDFMIMMPLGDSLMRHFQISPQQFSLLVSSYTFTAGGSGLLASMIADRYDRKSLLLFFYVGFGVCTLACGLADSYEQLLLARSLTGCFGGVLNSIVLAIASDSTPVGKRASAMGVVSTAFSFASIVGVPLSLFVANSYDWHAPFVGLGVLSLFLTGLIALIIPNLNGHLIEAKKTRSLDVIAEFLSEEKSSLALMFAFVLVLGHMMIIPFIAPTLLANVGLSGSELPYIYLFGGLCTILAAPLIGRISDKAGRHKVFRFAGLISLVPIFLITNLNRQPMWLVLIIAGFFFISMNGRMIPAMALLSMQAAPSRRGTFMSLVSAVQQFASGFGALVSGFIIHKSTEGRLENYPYAGAVTIGLTFLALWLGARLTTPETDPKAGAY